MNELCSFCSSRIVDIVHPVHGVIGVDQLCGSCAEQSAAAYQGFKNAALDRAETQYRAWLLEAKAAGRARTPSVRRVGRA